MTQKSDEEDHAVWGNSKMKKERWADTRIIIDFPLPNKVQEIVDELERFDLEGHYGYFEDCEYLDVFAKRFIGDGLTQEQYDLLLCRYHGGLTGNEYEDH